MPRSMADPDYVYRPHSAEHCAKLSLAHKKRLGIPVGFQQVYGTLVPDEHADRMREYAAIFARIKDAEVARDFVRSASTAGWAVDRPQITARGQRNWQLYRDLLAEGMSREEVAAFANVAEWYLNRGVSDHRKGRIGE